MAANKTLFKVFTAFKGLDLRSSDLLRESDASTEMKNVDYRQTGAMNKRKGYQLATTDDLSFGLTTYKNIDVSTGAKTEEVIGIDDNLAKLTDYSFTITYSGSNIGVYYRIYLNADDASFYFDIYDDNARVLNYNMGTGLEVSFKDIDDLRTAISAVTNFTAGAASGAATAPCAFIPVTGTIDLSSGSGAVNWTAWSAISTPSSYSTPFSAGYAKRTSSEFENATFAQINNVLYVANGYDVLHKYDGNRVHKAGMPQPTITSVADTGSGSTFTTGDKYDYKVVYTARDAKGNIHTGVLSDAKSLTKAASDDNTVTIPYIQNTTGYNTDQAIINGNQSGVTTITVDSGHNVLAGDYVYIDDGVSGDVVSRLVSSVTATTIVISGSAVNVTDNDIISNIKLELYRTKNYSGSGIPGTYYLVTDIVNDSATASIAYVDQVTDANLGVDLVEPVKAPALPPTVKYIDNWRGFLVAAGSTGAVTTVYYSDLNKPEAFDPASSFKVDSKITGLKSLDNIVYVFQENAVDGLAGDLVDDNFQVDKLTREVGTESHHSIQPVKGELFFLHNTGIFSIGPNGVSNVGFPIEPKFSKSNPFSFKRAVGYNWVANNSYMIFMPQEDVNASYSDDSDNEIYVFNYFRKAWLEWSNFNFMGGITESNRDIFFSRRTSSNNNLVKLLQDNLASDYADHTTAITFTYKSHWEALGEPSVWKKYLRCKLHSYDVSIEDFESDEFTVALTTENDYTAKTLTNVTYDFSGGEEGWGADAWGNFRWGQKRLTQIKKKLASKKARSMRVILNNSTLKQNVLISGYEIETVVPYRAELKE